MSHFTRLYFDLDVAELLVPMHFIARYFGHDPAGQDFPIILKQSKKSVSYQVTYDIENVRRILFVPGSHQGGPRLRSLRKELQLEPTQASASTEAKGR